MLVVSETWARRPEPTAERSDEPLQAVLDRLAPGDVHVGGQRLLAQPMPPDADAVLMQRLASGEDGALNELMERWRDKVGAFIYRMTHDHAVTVDLTQETFVRP